MDLKILCNNIKTGYNQLINLNLNDDPCVIKDYILKQLQKQDIMSIINFGNRNISPSIYACLHECPVTSIAVERSFSMLNKMLCEDRQFAKDNIFKYFCFYNNYNVG